MHRWRWLYPDENEWKSGESVWHAFGLKNGNRTVRFAVRGEPGPGRRARWQASWQVSRM